MLHVVSLALVATSPRRVSRVEKPGRLPVWPVANGIVACALDVVGLEGLAAKIEESFGGRVAPMMLDVQEADPFVLLVHHRHAFDPWDPIRPLFRAILPEGFPAHPHRGFETVTATISGGLSHRDSMGVKEEYGDGDVQWLTAGRGILHEEMWWHPKGRDCELYQLWVNSPSKAKGVSPSTTILRDPSKKMVGEDVTERHLGGELSSEATGKETGPDRDDVRVARIEFEKIGSRYSINLPSDATALVYVRRGSVKIGEEEIERHRLAYTAREGDGIVLTSLQPHTDVLLLCALPLREPIQASGTWVVNSEADLARADADYRAGKMGVPWDHALPDDEWRDLVSKYRPS